MSTATATAPFTQPRRRLRVGARILGSKLAGALTYPHGADRYAEILRPVFSLSEPRAEVVDVCRPAAEMVGLTLRPNNNWDGFRAGQFANVGVEIDGRRHTRCYSPSRSAHDPELIELTIRAHPGGLVSNHLAEHAHEGMVVRLSEPQGEFHLPDARPARMTLISGGSGITPVISMLRTLRDEGSDARATFIHYARSADHVPYRDELAEIERRLPGVRVAIAHTRDGDAELAGHFGPAHLAALGVDPAESDAFVCGPAALIDGARDAWEAAGAAERFHSESFVLPSFSPSDTETADATVSFAGSGVEVENDGRTLLEQAEAAGLSPAHGCRMGICHSCTCRIASGAVRDVRSGEVKELVDSEAQICVSVPVSDIELEI
jgi:ferredoxin-NADP reductase